MKLINHLFTIAVIKLYFFILGEEEITRTVGETIKLRTQINEVNYDCTCQEIIFKAHAKKILSSTRVNRLYNVTMISTSDSVLTKGTYPVLCPNGFIYTNYPHMLAIRCHYHLFYK